MNNYRVIDKITVRNRIDHFTVLPTDEQINELYDGELGTLMLESVSIDDIDSTYHVGMPVANEMFLEAIKTTTSRIDMTMKAFARAFNQQAQGSGITANNVEVGRPRKSGSIAIVTSRMQLSDGQSISVVFHNPSEMPDKINPGDTLVAFRFMLNGRDITHVVAPNGGKDISLKQSTLALANVAERNSARFQENKAKNEQLKLKIEEDELKAEQIQTEIAQASDDIDQVNIKWDEGQEMLDSLQQSIDWHNKHQDELRQEIEALQNTAPQVAKYWYGLRVRPFDIASQPSGHTAYLNAEQAKGTFSNFTERDYRYGAVGYKQPLSFDDIAHYNMTSLNLEPTKSGDLSKKGLVALSAVIDTYLSKTGSNTLKQDDVDLLLDLYDNATGDALSKLQATFSYELKNQPEFLNRKEQVSEFDEWLDALRTLDRKDVALALEGKVIHVFEPALDMGKDIELITSIRDSLFSGKISLKSAKERFMQTASNLPKALMGEVSDVQLATRKDQYVKYLTSFIDRLTEFDPQAPVVTTADGTIDFNEMTYDAMDQHGVFGKTLAQVAKVNPQAVIDYLKDTEEWTSIPADLLKSAASKAQEHYLPPRSASSFEEDENVGRVWNSKDGQVRVLSMQDDDTYLVGRESRNFNLPEMVKKKDLQSVIDADERALATKEQFESDGAQSKLDEQTQYNKDNPRLNEYIDSLSVSQVQKAKIRKALEKRQTIGDATHSRAYFVSNILSKDYVLDEMRGAGAKARWWKGDTNDYLEGLTKIEADFAKWIGIREKNTKYWYALSDARPYRVGLDTDIEEIEFLNVTNARSVFPDETYPWGIVSFGSKLSQKDIEYNKLTPLFKNNEKVSQPGNELSEEETYVEQLKAIQNGENTDIEKGLEIMEDAYLFFEKGDLLDEYMDLLDAASDAHTELQDAAAA